MKIEGANAPPTSLTKPLKRGFGRVFAAWWPHPGGTTLRLVIFPYLVLDFPFQLLDLTKQSLIFSFNQLICRDLF